MAARHTKGEVCVPGADEVEHVAEDPEGAVDAPDQAAAEEGADEEGAVDGLVDAAG